MDGKDGYMAPQTKKARTTGKREKGKAARKKKKGAPEKLLDSMNAIIDAVETGKPLTVRRIPVIKPPAPMSASGIVKVRKQLNVSQAVFAVLLGVSSQTVKAWEQSNRKPTASALRLLHFAEQRPRVLMETITAAR